MWQPANRKSSGKLKNERRRTGFERRNSSWFHSTTQTKDRGREVFERSAQKNWTTLASTEKDSSTGTESRYRPRTEYVSTDGRHCLASWQPWRRSGCSRSNPSAFLGSRRRKTSQNARFQKRHSKAACSSTSLLAQPHENGGETGIRTLETVARLHAFQACAFDHSATSPARVGLVDEGRLFKRAMRRAGRGVRAAGAASRSRVGRGEREERP